MIHTLKQILASNDYRVRESFTLPSRPAAYLPIPGFLNSSGVMDNLAQSLGGAGAQLWRHQALALEAFGKGQNVVVATGTASGKSTVFRAAAFHLVRLSSNAKVVVFYPLKALAADQMNWWAMSLMDRVKVSASVSMWRHHRGKR